MIHGLALAIIGVLLAGCATTLADISGLVLARVNDEAITVQDLQDGFTSSHQGHGAFLAGQDAIRTFLEKEVDRRLLIQEARRVGTDRDARVVEVRESLRRRRATEAFYKERVDGRVVVTDEAIARAYERMGLRFSARHILVNTREAAEAARAKIAGGEAFGEVARDVSRADSASKGGDMGIVRSGQIDPALEERLWAMGAGELSQPFETQEGWNLLLAVERVEVERPKSPQVRNQIRARLAQREKERLTRDLHRQVLERAQAVVRASAVIDAALAGRPAAAEATVVVAEGGGEQITLGQVLPLIDAEALRKYAPARREPRMRAFLETELARRLIAAQALAEGYGDRPAVKREIERVTEAATLTRFLDTIVFVRLDVTDAEARAYWSANQQPFTEPRAVKVSAIFLETEAEANATVAALADGKDFGALARASKNVGIASSSGNLGWVTEGRLQPSIEKVAFALPEGGVGVARVDTGYVVVRAEERRDSRVKPFAEVREQARESALRARGQEILKTWVTKLRAASTIEIDAEALARAVSVVEKDVRERAAKQTPGMPGKHGGHARDETETPGKPGEPTVR